MIKSHRLNEGVYSVEANGHLFNVCKAGMGQWQVFEVHRDHLQDFTTKKDALAGIEGIIDRGERATAARKKNPPKR